MTLPMARDLGKRLAGEPHALTVVETVGPTTGSHGADSGRGG